MKVIFVVSFVLTVICTSCKSYLEYTVGTKELDYSVKLNKVKRYSSIEAALVNPWEVEFLDLNLQMIEDKQEALTTLNEKISQFKNLKKLVISNALDANLIFPMDILKHQPIEFLVIQSWQGLSPEIFNSLPQLKNLIFLGFPDCKLNKFPSSLCAIEKLQGLDFHANCVEQVPEEIEQLKDLRTIDLTNNGLRSFPIELSACKKLQWLDINNAEGNNVELLKSHGFCVNLISDFRALKNFESLKSVTVLKLVDSNKRKE